MKPRALLPLIVSLLLIAAFVIGATVIESSYQWNALAWIWAQRKLPLLWLVDAFALLTLFPVFGLTAAQNRLAGKSKEIAQMQDTHHQQTKQLQNAHHDQLEQMLQNATKSEQRNAEQAEQIHALQQTVEEWSVKLEAMQAEAVQRQQALEEEALRIAAQAFSALMDRVETNARQMEAVNLAVQYQRAEIKQLRQGVRILQHNQESTQIAHLTPAEIAAIAGEETPSAENKNDRRIEGNKIEGSKIEGSKIEGNKAGENREERQKEESETATNRPDTALVYRAPETSLPFRLTREAS